MEKIKTVIKNPFLLAVVSAVLLRLAYPKFNLWFLAWVAFLPLFFAIQGQNLKKTFWISLLSGTIFFILTMFWLIHVTVPGMFLLSVYLGFYVALFCVGLGLLERHLSFWTRLFFAPAWWVVLEFCRAHFLTGFPWALLAYSQTFAPAAIQVADLAGAAGVSFMVVFVNKGLFEFWSAKTKGASWTCRRFWIPLFLVFLWMTYGTWRLHQDPRKTCPVKMAVVQGNIPQDVKWIPWLKEKILKKYQLLSEIVSLKNEPDIILWPETAYPDFWGTGGHEGAFCDFVQQLRTPLLVGLIRQQGSDYFNSAFLFSSTGNIEAIYDKIHLVPFGEYIPLRRFLSFLEALAPIADFEPGRSMSLFSVKGAEGPALKLGVLICFEDIFSDLASAFVRRGADVLVNITNDAWFGDTASPYQHLQASVLRAVENRVFVVRSANTGVSGLIDDAGRIQGTVHNQKGKETFITGDYTGTVYRTQRRSLYTRTGDLFSFLCAVFVGGLVGLVFCGRSLMKKALIVLLILGFSLTGRVSLLCAAQDQQREIAIRYYRGVVYYEAGNYDNALTEFQSVTALDPYYRDTQRYIENCIKILEQYRQSVVRPVGDEASRKSSMDLYFLGKSYFEKKDYRRALEVFRSVLAKDPGDRFASYYAQLCESALTGRLVTSAAQKSPQEQAAERIQQLENEIAYIKSDMRSQEDMERFLAKKAERHALRDELIQKKEQQLKEQEEILEEERQDYLAQAQIAKRADRIRRETEKWKSKKEQLAVEEPGVAAELSEYPIYLHKAEGYYTAMKEALRLSRWNTAGLNAIKTSLFYCDALLIYHYSVKSASPAHENINRLLLANVKRSDVEENVYHLRSVLNLKKIIEEEDRPLTRSEALFLAEHTERIVEWCKSMFP